MLVQLEAGLVLLLVSLRLQLLRESLQSRREGGSLASASRRLLFEESRLLELQVVLPSEDRRFLRAGRGEPRCPSRCPLLRRFQPRFPSTEKSRSAEPELYPRLRRLLHDLHRQSRRPLLPSFHYRSRWWHDLLDDSDDERRRDEELVDREASRFVRERWYL